MWNIHRNPVFADHLCVSHGFSTSMWSLGLPKKGVFFGTKTNICTSTHTYIDIIDVYIYIYMQVSNPGIVWEGSIGETGVIAVMGRACSKSGQCMEMQWSGLLPISGLRAANSSDEFMRRVLGESNCFSNWRNSDFFFLCFLAFLCWLTFWKPENICRSYNYI